MRTFAKFLLSAILASGVISIESPIPGYGVEILQWDVEVAPGQIHTLNGTVQDVYAQALTINPDITPFQVSGSNAKLPRGSLIQMEKRSYICNGWSSGWPFAFQSGIDYLRGVPGQPTNGPGPGNCGRVSCSYDSAIWWCNDNSGSKTLDNFSYLANSAKYLLDTCPTVGIEGKVSGQNFELGNWNVIIRGDSC